MPLKDVHILQDDACKKNSGCGCRVIPATPLIESRVRFCMSASLTKEDIDYVLRHVSEVGDKLKLKLNSGQSSWDGKVRNRDIEEVIRRTPEDSKEDKYFLNL